MELRFFLSDQHKQAVGQTVELHMIWDDMTLIWDHFNNMPYVALNDDQSLINW